MLREPRKHVTGNFRLSQTDFSKSEQFPLGSKPLQQNLKAFDTLGEPSSVTLTPLSFLSADSWAKYSHVVLLLYCVSAALSIAASQLLLIPLVAYWLLVLARDPEMRRILRNEQVAYLTAPILLWFGANICAAVTGIDPLRSILEALKTSIFLFIPYVVYSSLSIRPLSPRAFLGRVESYVVALILGQSLAALHTVIEELFPGRFPSVIPGPLTESGQLVLILPLVFATAFHALSFHGQHPEFSFRLFGFRLNPKFYSSLLFIALLIVVWPGAILWEESSVFHTLMLRSTALLLVFGLSIPPLYRGAPAIRENLSAVSRTLRVELFRLVWPVSALLFASLLINLKRGPWLGVFVELLVLGYLLSRRLLFWSVLLSFVLLLSLSPTRTRMANLNEHFSIGGGRKEMWELGSEILQRYPLGLGPNNARFMRQLDPGIPQTHRHMHNNFLNVLVETGWIGFFAFLWWMAAVIKYGFRLWKRFEQSNNRICEQLSSLALCLSIALLGWQVSGLVEYNFGDGEIRLIAFLFMGLLLTLGSFAERKLEGVDSEDNENETSRSISAS